MRACYGTDAGRKRRFGVINSWQAMLRADGSFIAHMVAPGNYVTGGNTVDLSEAFIDQIHFTVPPAASAADAATPIDIGTVTLREPVKLKIGETAPDFSARTLDGGAIKLGDLRGKYVLLDFWATWCGPCVKETPHLQATYHEFASDKRFTMVSLSCDSEAEAPRQFVKKNDIAWQQIFLGGSWPQDTVSKNYGITAIPQIVLIGPDGKILARDLRGENIQKAVAKALAN